MSLPVFQATVVNDSGDIIPSPVITVVIESSGLPATLFSDRNGTVPLGTGGVFNGGVDGFSQFYAEPNEYRVTAEDSGSGFSITWRYVVLSGTAATSNIQASPTDATVGAVLTNETTEIGGKTNYTSANYQPEDRGGVGVVLELRNNSGSQVNKDGTAIGSLLRFFRRDSTGLITSTASGSGAHVYQNVGLDCPDNEVSNFVRIS